MQEMVEALEPLPIASGRYQFELVDRRGVQVGGGWIIAPGPAAAVRSASLLMGGSSDVRLKGEMPGV